MIDKFEKISRAAKQIMNARMPDSNHRPKDHEITLKEKKKLITNDLTNRVTHL